jgi:hypothetical protein
MSTHLNHVTRQQVERSHFPNAWMISSLIHLQDISRHGEPDVSVEEKRIIVAPLEHPSSLRRNGADRLRIDPGFFVNAGTDALAEISTPPRVASDRSR